MSEVLKFFMKII